MKMELLNEAKQLAEHLGCTEEACIEDALLLVNEGHKEYIQLYDPIEIDDDYADSDDNETICHWTSSAPNY